MKIVKFGQILKRCNTLDFSGGSLASLLFIRKYLVRIRKKCELTGFLVNSSSSGDSYGSRTDKF